MPEWHPAERGPRNSAKDQRYRPCWGLTCFYIRKWTTGWSEKFPSRGDLSVTQMMRWLHLLRRSNPGTQGSAMPLLRRGWRALGLRLHPGKPRLCIAGTAKNRRGSHEHTSFHVLGTKFPGPPQAENRKRAAFHDVSRPAIGPGRPSRRKGKPGSGLADTQASRVLTCGACRVDKSGRARLDETIMGRFKPGRDCIASWKRIKPA